MPAPGDQDIRCFCAKRPLLAICGRDNTGKLFVHAKVYRGGRLFGEWIAQGGKVSLRCRDCGRWHKITMRQDSLAYSRTVEPPIKVFSGDA